MYETDVVEITGSEGMPPQKICEKIAVLRLRVVGLWQLGNTCMCSKLQQVFFGGGGGGGGGGTIVWIVWVRDYLDLN